MIFEKQKNIFPVEIENNIINRKLNSNTPKIFWFTGLSGSGKTTLGLELKKILDQKNMPVVLLDGDNIRNGINSDLGFSDDDRKENIRRTGEITKILYDIGLSVIVTTISPFISSRNTVRNLFNIGDFFEIFIDCDIKKCEKRDPKKLYELSNAGLIREFTGHDSIYEKPLTPDLVINTNFLSVRQANEILSTFVSKIFSGY